MSLSGQSRADIFGDRDGVYSLMVSGNWRITFCYDANDDEIYDLDFEDYH